MSERNERRKSTFPPGSTFWTLKGVPMVMNDHGSCTAWDQSTVMYEQAFDSGEQISEAEFYSLVSAQGRLKNSTYAPDTSFAEMDGVPIVIDPRGFCTALAGRHCTRRVLHDEGRYITEAEFLALAGIYRAKLPWAHASCVGRRPLQ